jgi:hypothetical protein
MLTHRAAGVGEQGMVRIIFVDYRYQPGSWRAKCDSYARPWRPLARRTTGKTSSTLEEICNNSAARRFKALVVKCSDLSVAFVGGSEVPKMQPASDFIAGWSFGGERNGQLRGMLSIERNMFSDGQAFGCDFCRFPSR